MLAAAISGAYLEFATPAMSRLATGLPDDLKKTFHRLHG